MTVLEFPPARRHQAPTTLVDLVRAATEGEPGAVEALWWARPEGPRDALLALAELHDLAVAPLVEVGERARALRVPAVVALKARLEDDEVARLDVPGTGATGGDGAVARVRRLAAQDLVPPVYEWLAAEADLAGLRRFLALEGGPDGGFDDLVAICQVGLDGPAKLELATNYWDEMGRGEPAAVHTELHRRLVVALELEAPPRAALPLPALRRSVLGGLLATNRWAQPEMVGALGLTELQAGPRCRKVLTAFDRLGIGDPDARAFYEEHAEADPRHGRDWLDHVVAEVGALPGWADRVVRGGRWRATTNAAFFTWAAQHLTG